MNTIKRLDGKSLYGYCRISTRTQDINRQIRSIQAQCNNKAIIVQEAYTGRTFDRPQWNKLQRNLKAGDTIVFDSVSRMSRNADDGFTMYEKLYKQGITLVFLNEPHINTDVFRSQTEGIKIKDLNIDTGKNKEALYNFIQNNIENIYELLMNLAKEQIRLAFNQAQKEVDDLSQRTKGGIETARLNGKQIGQKAGIKLTIRKEPFIKNVIKEQCRDFLGTLNDSDVMAIIVSRLEEHNKKEETKPPKERNILQAKISRNTYYKYKRELAETPISE